MELFAIIFGAPLLLLAFGTAFILLNVLWGLVRLVFRLLFSVLFRLVSFGVGSVVRRLASLRHLDPYRRGLSRSTLGSFLLALSIYAGTQFPVLFGQKLETLFWAFWRSPTDPPPPLLIYSSVIALSVIWLAAGVVGALRGGDRDWMSVFWSSAAAGGAFYLMQHGYDLPREWQQLAGPSSNTALHGVYIAAIAAGLVRLSLSVPVFGNALRAIKRQIKTRNTPLRPAHARRFFFFW
jgi:hypothetical protein